MGYFVRYGFGSDYENLLEMYLNSCEDVGSGGSFIRTAACFSGFIEQRTSMGVSYTESKENPILYSMNCYIPWLKEAVNWLNSLNCGIFVKIIKIGRASSYLASFEKETEGYVTKLVHKEFQFGKKYVFTDKNSAKAKNIKVLPIYTPAILIKVSDNKSFLSKVILEYLVLCFLRQLSVDDSYFDDMKNEGTILERILDVSAPPFGCALNHSLCDHPISYENFTKCLDINNVEKIIQNDAYIGRPSRWHSYSQTKIIDSILERITANDSVS